MQYSGVLKLLSCFLCSIYYIQASNAEYYSTSIGVGDDSSCGKIEAQIISPLNSTESVVGDDIIIECNISKFLYFAGYNHYTLKTWFCNSTSDPDCHQYLKDTSLPCPNSAVSCRKINTTGKNNISRIVKHTIKDAKKRESGEYYCVAQGHLPCVKPRTMSNFVHINIRHKRRLEFNNSFNRYRSIKQREGNSIDIMCVCHGYPTPLITWYRNGNLIQNESRNWIGLKNFSENDAGNYTCACENRLEKITSEKTAIHVQKFPGKQPFIIVSVSGVIIGILGSCIIIQVNMYTKCKRKKLNYFYF